MKLTDEERNSLVMLHLEKANKNINCITTREQYDEIRSRMDVLIKKATSKGLLESGEDNEYVREISRLAKLSAEYEDNFLKSTFFSL